MRKIILGLAIPLLCYSSRKAEANSKGEMHEHVPSEDIKPISQSSEDHIQAVLSAGTVGVQYSRHYSQKKTTRRVTSYDSDVLNALSKEVKKRDKNEAFDLSGGVAVGISH